MSEGGYIEGLDGDRWAEMGRVGRGRGGGGKSTAPSTVTPPPPHATTNPKPQPPSQDHLQTQNPSRPPQKTNHRVYFESSEDSSDGAISRGGTKKQKTHHSTPKKKAIPAPKSTHTLKPLPPNPSPQRPRWATLPRTQSPGPSPTSPTLGGGGIGIVRGVRRTKGGVVWVEYLGNTTLYEVARSLLCPSSEEAETYRREVVEGKKKAKTPTNPSNPKTHPPSNQPQPIPTEPPDPVDKENNENKEQEGGDPAKGSHEP